MYAYCIYICVPDAPRAFAPRRPVTAPEAGPPYVNISIYMLYIYTSILHLYLVLS